ncbi:MAG: contractile injection system tape measure protein [Bacteroidota bacterium]
MDENRHIIKRQIFNVEVGAEKEAPKIQEEVSRIYHAKLAPLIEKHLARYDQQLGTIRLEQLVLNCEYLHADHLEERLIAALEEQLPLLLASQIQRAPTAPSKNIAPAAPGVDSQQKLLQYFLRTGHFPWWASTTAIEFNSLLKSVLDRQAEWLFDFLRKTVGQTSVLRRLCCQTHPQVLEKIERQLLRDRLVRIQKHHQKLLRYFQRGLKKSIPLQPLALLLRQGHLHYALQYGQQSFDETLYFRCTLESIRKEQNTSLYRSVEQMLQRKKDKGRYQRFNDHLAKEWSNLMVREKQREKHLTRNWRPRAALFFFIQKGFFPEGQVLSMEELNEVVVNIFEKEKGSAYEQLTQLLVEEGFRLRLMHHLSARTLAYCVSKLLRLQKMGTTSLREDCIQLFEKVFRRKYTTQQLAAKIDQTIFYCAFQQELQPFQLIHLLQALLQKFSREQRQSYLQLIHQMVVNSKQMHLPNKDLLLSTWFRLYEQSLEGEANQGHRSVEQQLFHYLSDGSWEEGELVISPADLEKSWQTLLKENRPHFKKQLLHQLHKEKFRKRLLQQFSETTLQMVFVLLLGDWATKIPLYKKDLLTLFRQMYPRRYDRQKFAKQLDQLLLAYVVNRNHWPFQATFFLEKMLTDMQALTGQTLESALVLVNASFPELIRQKLLKSQLLHAAIPLAEQEEYFDNKTVTNHESDFIANLQHYLNREGQHPYSTRKSERDWRQDLSKRLLEKDPALLEFLQQHLRNTTAVEQLFDRFSPEVCLMVSNALFGRRSELMEKYFKDLRYISELALVGPFSKSQVNHFLELGVFLYLSQGEQSVFDPSSFLKKICQYLSQALPFPLEKLLLRIEEKARLLDQRQRFASPLPDLLRQIFPQQDQQEGPLQQQKDAASIQWLHYFLEKGKLPQHSPFESLAELEDYFLTVLSTNAGEAKRLLKTYLPKNRSLHYLLHHFSAKTIAHISQTMAASEWETAQKYLTDFRKIMAAMYVGVHSKKLLNRQIDAAFLTYCTSGQRGVFKPLVFINAILDYLAKAFNTTLGELSELAKTKAQRMEQEVRFASPLSDLLQQLEQEEEAKHFQHSINSPKASTDHLLYFLQKGTFAPDAVMPTMSQLENQFLQALKTAHPVFLTKVLEVLREATAFQHLTRQFSEVLRHDLLQVLNHQSTIWKSAYHMQLGELLHQVAMIRYPMYLIQRELDFAVIKGHVVHQKKEVALTAFVDTLVMHLSDSFAIGATDLSRSLEEIVQTMRRSGSVVEPLLQVLSERQVTLLEKRGNKASTEAIEAAIFAFVKTGRFKRQAVLGQREALEQQLILLLEKGATTFMRQMRASLKATSVLPKVIDLMTLPLLERWTELLWDDVPLIARYRQDFRQLFAAVPDKLEPRQGLPNELEKVLLLEGAARSRPNFQAPHFVLQIIRRLAMSYGLNVSTLLKKSVETARQIYLKKGFQTPLPNLLWQIREQPPIAVRAVNTQSVLEVVRYFLTKGQLPAASPQFETVLDLELQLLKVVKQKDVPFLRNLKDILTKSKKSQQYIQQLALETQATLGQVLGNVFLPNLREISEDLQLLLSKMEALRMTPQKCKSILNLTALEILTQNYSAASQENHYFERVLLNSVEQQVLPNRVYFEKVKQTLQVLTEQKILKRITKTKLQNWSFQEADLKSSLQVGTDVRQKANASRTEQQVISVLLQLLGTFLLTGHFESRKSVSTFLDFEWQLTALCKKGGKKFLHQLRQTWQKGDKHQKRIKAFAPQSLRSICQAINKQFSKGMEDLMSDLKQVLHGLEQLGSRTENIQLLVDESRLTTWTKAPNGTTTESELVRHVLHQLTQVRRMPLEVLGPKVLQETKKLRKGGRLKSQLWKHLQSIDFHEKEAAIYEEREDALEEMDPERLPLSEEQPLHRPTLEQPILSGNYLLDLLQYWLTFGETPWWSKNEEPLDEVLLRLGEEDPKRLLDTLRYALERPQQIQDFLNQLSEESQDSILHLLLGPEAGWVKKMFQLLAKISKTKEATKKEQQPTSLDATLFATLLHQYQFGPELFLHHCVLRLAQWLNCEWRPSLKKLKKGVKQSACFTEKRQQIILTYLKRLAKDQASFEAAATAVKFEQRKRFAIHHQFRKQQGVKQLTINRAFEQVEYYFVHGSFRDTQVFATRKEFNQTLKRLLRQFSLPSKAMMMRLLRQHQLVENIVDLCPKKMFILLIQLFYPNQSQTIVRLQATLLQLLPKGKVSKKMELRNSQVHLLRFMGLQKDAVFQMEVYVQDWCKMQAANRRLSEKQVIEQLLQNTSSMPSVIDDNFVQCLEALSKKQATEPSKENPWKKMEEQRIQLEEAVYVHNAGLVIISPFLPRYFGMLGMLEERQFKDEIAAERAVLLTQYLVSGRTETPEYLLVLNKIFCGLAIETPVPLTIELTEEEKKISGEMMNAILQNWPQMKTSSLDGFQGGFLIRDGRLEEEDDYWALDVESKSFDVLLQSLPWSISIINHPWMNKRIQVKWI